MGGVKQKSMARKGRITVKDLARELDVSIATVSRALSDDQAIATATRDRVLTKAREMGYTPNLFARGLITQRSRIAALFASNITNPFYPEVVVKLTRRLQELDLHTMLFTSTANEEMSSSIPMLRQFNPDIVIVLAATMSSDAVQRCADANIPLILFNRYVTGSSASASAICCDNYEGGRLVARRLIEAGHRKLAFISGLGDTSTNADRLRGFCESCSEAGIDTPTVISGGDFTYETGDRGMRELCAGAGRPDAVLCANDIVAVGAMDAARGGLGLRVPEDISIVGFDDIAMAAWPSHSLTTMRQPMNKMIDCVIEETKRLLGGTDREPRQYFLPGQLIVRTSARLSEEKT